MNYSTIELVRKYDLSKGQVNLPILVGGSINLPEHSSYSIHFVWKDLIGMLDSVAQPIISNVIDDVDHGTIWEDHPTLWLMMSTGTGSGLLVSNVPASTKSLGIKISPNSVSAGEVSIFVQFNK